MSTNLNLVIYQHENGELIEEGMKTVRCEEITPQLLKRITDSFPMKETKVYFDRKLEESFEIQYFESTDTASISKILCELFCSLLAFENNLLNPIVGETLGQASNMNSLVSIILPEQNQQDPIEVAIERFSMLIGVIGLFRDKQDKLPNEIGAIIKLG
ncbi:MAG: hypothetical protein HHJ17_18240 [Rhodoferax sp.]|uniref:hypothetical protein n=1 Tax=Rhodoferax sp. TaxID=50421 RepID=UPI0017DD20B9|nr:hypothetical protein [Rhodoferax sp.]NMM15462.1 hypothetical protein [Rhodoferax sp.]